MRKKRNSFAVFSLKTKKIHFFYHFAKHIELVYFFGKNLCNLVVFVFIQYAKGIDFVYFLCLNNYKRCDF